MCKRNSTNRATGKNSKKELISFSPLSLLSTALRVVFLWLASLSLSPLAASPAGVTERGLASSLV
jgi:hypothetical protein